MTKEIINLALVRQLTLLAAGIQLLLAPSARACGDPLFSPQAAVARDSYLLTEGESLRLSCRVCGACVPSYSPACSDPNFQAWMTPGDSEKAAIRARTKIRKPKQDKKDKKDKSGGGGSRSFRRLVSRIKELAKKAKEKAQRAKKRLLKVALTAKHQMSIAVQRFDRLKSLALESESGVGIIKELWNPDIEDARLQWFMETATGETSRVKHDALGIRLLFDMLVISRASTSNTGMYTCRWSGRVVAQFGVTVVDSGVEPFREFEPNTGRSLQPKRLPKANLEVYTRWMEQTMSLLLPSNETSQSPPPSNGTVAAVNISISWGICYVKQLDLDRSVVPEGSPSLKLMPLGLPCRSHLLPLSVRSLRSIIMRPSEASKLSTIVYVNHSALQFGLKQASYDTKTPAPLSVDATVVKRSFMIAKQGEFVSLECPLKQTVRTLIAWFVLRNDSKQTDRIRSQDIVDGVLNPYNLRETSGGRMFTDPGGNLNVANVAKAVDQRKYFCLHNSRLVGYVNLIIRHTKEESYGMHLITVFVSVLQVLSPLVIVASIIFLTLVSASSIFEPEVPW